MMTRLFLIRHGETEWSKSGKHTSVTDVPLTELGEEQARKLLGHVQPAHFGLVLSSPRRRAWVTAELAGFIGPYAPKIDEDLVEWSYGDFEGLTSGQIRSKVPDWTIWTHPAPGGETASEVAARLDRVITRVRTSGVDRAICFGHGHALRALTMRWLNFDLSLGVQFPLDTSTISVLGEEKNRPALWKWNAAV
jgi:broad specificity phosphatase PhoE